MSDPSQPKGRAEAPAEGPTKTFQLKFDGWMTEMLKRDLGADPAETPADPPAADAADAPEAAATPAAQTAQDGTAVGGRTGPSSG